MSLGELLEEGAEDGKLGRKRGGMRVSEVVSMRGILGRGYSSAVKGREADFLGHGCCS